MRPETALERLCALGAQEDMRSALVVAAHPDDETIGAGGRIAKLGTRCIVVHVTDGAPGDRRMLPAPASHLSRLAYARARHEEAVRALGLVGLDPSHVLCMGVREQEAALDMPTIADRLRKIIRDVRPELVVTHPYEGGHPDHDSVALAVHAALALHRPSGDESRPVLIEMTSYHDEGGATVRGEFLLAEGSREATVQLTEEERRTKRAMFAAYCSQREVLSRFTTEMERFRVAPRYAFGVPPHEGRLHYERFGFRMQGTMWRALARSALKKLSLSNETF